MLYRLAVYLLDPYTLALLLVWLATAWLWFPRSRPYRRLALLCGALLLLSVVSMPAVGHLAIGSIERLHASSPLPDEVQAIVVLGGATSPQDESGTEVILAADSMIRCLRAARLYSEAGPCPIVLTGGKADPDLPGPPVARAMRDFLLTQGVAPRDMVVEESSTSTHENAVRCRPLLEERGLQRIVLVTDGLHMCRAVRCFAKQGMEVTAAPCNFRAAYFEWSLGSFAPSRSGLNATGAATHEWLGLAWYWLHGRI